MLPRFGVIHGLLVLLASFLLPRSAGAEASISWHVGYGTNLEEHVHEGHQTSDGGYVAIGHVMEAEGSDNLDMLVVKIDALGNEQWQTRIGTDGAMDVGLSIAETATGFVAGGGLHAGGRQAPALVGLDENGSVLWQRTYDGSGAGGVRGIEVLEDGGLVATGYRGAEEEGFLFLAEAQAFLLRTDSQGRSTWLRSLDAMQGTKVRAEADGNFVVLGAAWGFSGGRDVLNARILRTGPGGNTTWSTTISGANHVDIFDFDAVPEGGWVLGGHTTDYGATNWDCVMIRVDAAGNESWARRFGQPRGYNPSFIHDECYGIRTLPDGGFLMIGGTGDEYRYSESGHPAGPSDEWKVYMVRTDSAGMLQWEAALGDGPDQGNSAGEFLSLTDDGCFLVFTDTDSAGAPEPNNFGFMKVCATCGNGTVDEGESCDDGNLVDCDGCDSDCRPSSTCGNGILCGLETCDDGNTEDGDCCSGSCTFEAAGTSCEDGDLCTGPDTCDGAGTCSSAPAPAPTCTAVSSARIDLRDREGTDRDQLSWDAKKGPALAIGDLGDISGGNDDLALCLYARESGGSETSALASFALPGGGACGNKPCWKDIPGRKLLYRDRAGASDGAQLFLAKPGATGRSRFKLKAKGEFLALPDLPLPADAEVIAQLRGSNGGCWETVFPAGGTRNETDRFQARY